MNSDLKHLVNSVKTTRDAELEKDLIDKIDNKTKPVGSLGILEKIACRVGLIQKTLSPEFKQPTAIVFAADHGIMEEGVSAYPKEVTFQMVLNYLQGGAGANVFAAQHGIDMLVVDAGVDADFSEFPAVIDRKVARGTKNFLKEPAMSAQECCQAVLAGAEIVAGLARKGTNTVMFGEMGIGNTTSAALIMKKICDCPLDDCVGPGSGVSGHRLKHKRHVVAKALEKHPGVNAPFDVLKTFGGFEIAMMTGAFLQAAASGMLVICDGFITTSALLVAAAMNSHVADYCVFGHVSDEGGHRFMLKHLGADPVLNLGLRLGEGTGALVAYPIIKSAAEFLNKMASFESANVSKNI